MNTYFYLQSAMYLKFNQYYCIFENGETGILDLSDFDPKTGVFTYLETEENQKKFSIQNGVRHGTPGAVSPCFYMRSCGEIGEFAQFLPDFQLISLKGLIAKLFQPTQGSFSGK